jgi:hypothetical protein
MTIRRMEHVGVVVGDLAAATALFVAVGFERQGEGGRGLSTRSPLMPFAMPRWAASETPGRPASGRRTRR